MITSRISDSSAIRLPLRWSTPGLNTPCRSAAWAQIRARGRVRSSGNITWSVGSIKSKELNILHLRPGYFMENTLAQIGIIKGMGVAAGTLLPELKLQMIATRDIGAAAAESLLKLDFRGQHTRELQGQRDISMAEATGIIGAGVGKPDLAYIHLPDEQVRPALVQMGMSPNVAELILELSAALNSGHLAASEQRSAENTTATSYETFIAEEFVLRYQSDVMSAH
jgi:hypothetical protein